MTPAKPRIVILGAGPAGVGAAWKLRRRDAARVTVLEQQGRPGGNAGSFEFSGMRVDFGSHRLHPATSPQIMADIRDLLGDDLLDRPRHGRIGLRGKWIHFPGNDGDSFAEVLLTNLGPTICESFYFPYALKIWGRPPEQLSAIQARRRVSAGTFTKLARKVLSQFPGLKPKGSGRFFYPRHGYGQISEAYANAAAAAGADFRYGRRVAAILPPAGPAQPWIVESELEGGRERVEADQLWSTLPVTLLARLLGDAAPAAVHEAATKLEYRAMILVYLALPVSRFTEFDAHYFPGKDIRITRLSEPKNYSDLGTPAGQTVLCAELPCSPYDPWWNMDDAGLGQLVAGDLAAAGVPLPAPPVAVHVHRLRQAYPVYRTGYERWFRVLDAWVEGIPRLLSYGRQGLFAHDNTHHALAMAYAAADCLDGDRFDAERWARHRQVFETHVVED